MIPLELTVPGDKSIAHRALILGAMAQGDSHVSNLPSGADVASTLDMMRAFGAAIERSGERASIRGRGVAALRAPGEPIDCGNSGTTARLGIGLACALPGRSVFVGDESLSRRPMMRVVGPLRAAGARIEVAADGRLPVMVEGGRLGPIVNRDTTPSAQVKSALLLAGIAANVPLDIVAGASRDHTERMLRGMGLSLHDVGVEGHERFAVATEPPYALRPLDMAIPGDLSSAAFLVAASLLTGVPVVVRNVGVNPTRTGFLDVVARMGGRVELRAEREQGGEPVADLHVEPGPLVATDVGGAEIVRTIDELPLVAVLAARARGTTTVRDAAELRVKETDRIRAVCANLAAVGVRAEERSDGFAVTGTSAAPAGAVRAFGDHRIAMAFAVLGLRPGSAVVVDDPTIARVSFPEFADVMARLRAGAATMEGAH